MSSIQLYPEVRDASTLGPRYSAPLYLPIGVEGQADVAGTAVLAQIYQINRPSESDTYFGVSSPLGILTKFLLGRGIAPLLASASIKSASAPSLAQRQAVWANFESNQNVRIRMSDSTVQADLVALGTSCANADQLFNKQVAFGGMASGTTKAALITAAGAINSKRFVLCGPGVYDNSGTLLSGCLAAASVAAEVSKNSDIADDLDTDTINNLTGIELDAQGMPIFRKRVVSGSPVNDFEDLLQAGVSPLQNNRAGNGVQITHLRTTYVTDTTFDALMTRLIVDQVFIDVREYCYNSNFLRRGNTPATRADLQGGVEALLAERSNWIQPITMSNGKIGYGVGVLPSVDNRSVSISYQGTVVRGIQTIQVDAQLSIPV